MSESTIEITAGSGTLLHAVSNSIGGDTKLDQVMVEGQPQYDSYSAIASNVDVATANDHQLVIMGDGSNITRVTRLTIMQTGAAAADTTLEFAVYTVSTAGTGGAAITPAEFSEGTAFGGTAFSQPTSKGTEDVKLLEFRVRLSDSQPLPEAQMWTPAQYTKPITFSAATDGIAVKNIGSDASADITVIAEMIVTSY